MSKRGFYGVYGFYGGGVYVCDWPTLQEKMISIQGVKVKKLPTRALAVHFIVGGLVHDYHICEENEIREELLYDNVNQFLNMETLLVPSISLPSQCPYYIMA